MHRSVLTNGAYIRFARKNTVEVLTMEELDVALDKQSSHVRTYKERDPYGDETEYLVEFPGLTVSDLRALSNSKAIEYMQGNRIPYTAIVDPHTLDEMEGIRGVLSAKELIGRITPHVKALKVRHGDGLDREVWESVREAQVQVDIALASGKVAAALGIHRQMEKETLRAPELLRKRVELTHELILDEAGRQLDVYADRIEKGEAKQVARELEALALALADTRLAERAGGLVARLGAD